MNIERFIDQRKTLGFSQVELAEGICTQATLSRFENNGQIPSLKILIKLCNRLTLPLGELFPKVGIKNSELVEKMKEIEFSLITSEYHKAQELLNQLDFKQVKEANLSLYYLYLKGFLLIFLEEEATDVLFVFDKLLLDPSLKEVDIFRLLAYTGIGMVYSRKNELEKAEYYFNKVISEIYYFPTKGLTDTWRVLHIVFESGVFYAKMQELEASDALLEYVLSICSDNHVTYYLARAAFQLAENSIHQKKDLSIILEQLSDARAYAKINRNIKLLEKISALEKTYLDEQNEKSDRDEASKS